ncbi:hypothetical protein [Bifidobacterium sp. SO1]|uniref:hypothetical protein n=1 Tax=Bifidobacterium sp. SO1 TaxID=2809029 RepID=UPI001BDD03BD|nr:hypothetical protein [Bifidobacterium sp. SO1]MBT1163004.1 hypothetical protein [Bifidobacterium sp. SO1]
MAVNVTQKDETLHMVMSEIQHRIGVFADQPYDERERGYVAALVGLHGWCKSRLGYSGCMPLEVANQSEKADVQ